MGIGDWGLGIGDWGLGPIPNPQSPIPNPQSPIPNKYYLLISIKIFKLINKVIKMIYLNYYKIMLLNKIIYLKKCQLT